MLGIPAIQGPAVEFSSDQVAATFAVEVDALDPNTSLDQQVDKFLKEFTTVAPESLTRARLIVAGETAISVDMVPVQLSWRLVFVPHAGQLYRLMYWPVDVSEAQADLDELYQTTLGSFAFLSPGTAVSTNPTPLVETLPKQGLAVSYPPLNVVIPPELASGASGSQLPRVDGQNAAWFELTPGHTQLTLDGYMLQGKSLQPQFFVYPAKDYAELQAVAAQSMQRLQPILSNPQQPIAADQLPAVPFFNSVQVYAANTQVLQFKNGSGVRFLTQYAQTAAPANNVDLFYQFQGLTSDGAYYIVAIFPITAPGLGESSDLSAAIPINGVAYPGMGNPNADWQGYYAAVTGLLDSTPPKAFTPTLAQLDVMIESIQINP